MVLDDYTSAPIIDDAILRLVDETPDTTELVSLVGQSFTLRGRSSRLVVPCRRTFGS